MSIPRLLLIMAKDAEVSPAFQPLLGVAANFGGGSLRQVAHPMIQAPLPTLREASKGLISTFVSIPSPKSVNLKGLREVNTLANYEKLTEG